MATINGNIIKALIKLLHHIFQYWRKPSLGIIQAIKATGTKISAKMIIIFRKSRVKKPANRASSTVKINAKTPGLNASIGGLGYDGYESTSNYQLAYQVLMRATTPVKPPSISRSRSARAPSSRARR